MQKGPDRDQLAVLWTIPRAGWAEIMRLFERALSGRRFEWVPPLPLPLCTTPPTPPRSSRSSRESTDLESASTKSVDDVDAVDSARLGCGGAGANGGIHNARMSHSERRILSSANSTSATWAARCARAGNALPSNHSSPPSKPSKPQLSPLLIPPFALHQIPQSSIATQYLYVSRPWRRIGRSTRSGRTFSPYLNPGEPLQAPASFSTFNHIRWLDATPVSDSEDSDEEDDGLLEDMHDVERPCRHTSNFHASDSDEDSFDEEDDVTRPPPSTLRSPPGKNRKSMLKQRKLRSDKRAQATQDARLSAKACTKKHRARAAKITLKTPLHLQKTLADLPTAPCWTAHREKEQRRTIYSLADLTNRMGMQLVEWNGRDCRPLIDGNGTIFGVLAGTPRDALAWDAVHVAAAKAIDAARQKIRVPDKFRHHRRGKFPALPIGISHGGGQLRPSVLQNHANTPVLTKLFRKESLNRISGFVNSVFRTFAPRLCQHYRRTLEELRAHDPALIPAFSGNCLLPPSRLRESFLGLVRRHRPWVVRSGQGRPSCVMGPQVCHSLPPGSTIIIPSALIRHSNTSIAAHETRYSVAQYSAGGLFRWVHNGFQKEEQWQAKATSEEKHIREVEKEDRWLEGFKMLSMEDELINAGALRMQNLYIRAVCSKAIKPVEEELVFVEAWPGRAPQSPGEPRTGSFEDGGVVGKEGQEEFGDDIEGGQETLPNLFNDGDKIHSTGISRRKEIVDDTSKDFPEPYFEGNAGRSACTTPIAQTRIEQTRQPSKPQPVARQRVKADSSKRSTPYPKPILKENASRASMRSPSHIGPMPASHQHLSLGIGSSHCASPGPLSPHGDADGESPEEDSSNSEDGGPIIKPDGDVTRSMNRGGYNLEFVLGWDRKHYHRIRVFFLHVFVYAAITHHEHYQQAHVKNLADEHLDCSQSFTYQALKSVQRVKNLAVERFPELQRYKDCWPVGDMLRMLLKYRSSRARLEIMAVDAEAGRLRRRPRKSLRKS
ncbi:hypothetical protein BJ912DRAFT_923826 [Pholiota molesta]|nr:hypothetical protein BJ912DRAFT_923826 [Pholiota molesta]